MGTYNLSSDEIEEVFEKLEFESYCEGDFSEKDFLLGAKKYLKELRKQGAHISK
jgi:hypothetical protein